jgi:hypothetical protein
MLNDDKTRLPDEQNLAHADHTCESWEPPLESVALALDASLQADSSSPPKPHRNTGSLDSLGGGRLP